MPTLDAVLKQAEGRTKNFSRTDFCMTSRQLEILNENPMHNSKEKQCVSTVNVNRLKLIELKMLCRNCRMKSGSRNFLMQTKIATARRFFVKLANIKFYENLFSSPRDRQTDGWSALNARTHVVYSLYTHIVYIYIYIYIYEYTYRIFVYIHIYEPTY
jgi:hypothetical protein